MTYITASGVAPTSIMKEAGVNLEARVRDLSEMSWGAFVQSCAQGAIEGTFVSESEDIKASDAAHRGLVIAAASRAREAHAHHRAPAKGPAARIARKVAGQEYEVFSFRGAETGLKTENQTEKCMAKAAEKRRLSQEREKKQPARVAPSGTFITR